MSITGQVGYVSVAKQVDENTPNVTDAKYQAVKITGDSLVANNNMLVAEGEIGTGRDVTQAIPGGFSSAGAINGNLRTRAASIFLEAALGTKTVGVLDTPTGKSARDVFTPADDLPSLTIEKKIGTVSPQLIFLRYTGAMANTLNISIPSGGLATFSCGLIAKGEQEVATATDTTIGFNDISDELLAFYGGRVRNADTGTTLATANDDATFQSVEIVVNNNIQSDEYTVRPSRFLRSLTEGIRSIEANLQIVFEDNTKYEKYTYGKNASLTPGYNLYMGAFEVSLGNWPLDPADEIINKVLTSGTPASGNIQGLKLELPKLAFSGLPVALSSGRIVVSTTARALKPSGSNIFTATVRPTAEGLL